jgi:hypothetical protein
MFLPSGFQAPFIFDPANISASELADDEPESSAPMDPVAEPAGGDALAVEGILVMPFLQKALLASIVLGLLVFVLRRRRRSSMMVNEKSLA